MIVKFDRTAEIKKMRAEGKQYKEIAVAFGISKGRAHQIVNTKDGGVPDNSKLNEHNPYAVYSSLSTYKTTNHDRMNARNCIAMAKLCDRADRRGGTPHSRDFIAVARFLDVAPEMVLELWRNDWSGRYSAIMKRYKDCDDRFRKKGYDPSSLPRLSHENLARSFLPCQKMNREEVKAVALAYKPQSIAREIAYRSKMELV